jgi:hypothetical protein
VIDHDPVFRMFDPWVTQEFRIIDLLARRSGPASYVLDALWMLGHAPQDIAAVLRHVRPVSSFRTEFAYQKVQHPVAGRVLAKLASVPHRQNAVSPLGPRAAGPVRYHKPSRSFGRDTEPWNHATGHAFYRDRLTPLPPLASFPYALGPWCGRPSAG